MLTSELAARRRTIKAIVISILLGACATLVAVHLWTSWQSRSLQLANTRISSANTARALADQASSAFKMVDTVLVGLSDRIEADGLGPARKEALRSLMARHLAELPALQGLFVYDAAGRWIVNSAGSVYEGRSNADRAYYRFHRDHPGQGVHIGAPILGRTSGAWVIPVSRRLIDRDGRFAGVVLATIRIDFFRAVYERIDVRRDGAIVLALQDGTRLLGIPYALADVGRDIGADPLFARLAGSLLEGGEYDVSAAGVNRMVYFNQAGDYPLLVAVARSTDEALEGWRNNMVFVTCALLLLAVGLGLLGVWLARQLRARDGLERELLATKAALEASNATLASQANIDPLTKLFNKRYYERALQHELACARREGAPLAALMLDVDHFKKYNDRYGHMAGDACLLQVAEAIRASTARPRDVAARFGGEEFVVLLPCTDQAGALVVAEGIRSGLEQRAIAHQDALCGRVTLSIGVWALAPGQEGSEGDDGERARLLMERADAALYRAKEGGRNRVVADVRDAGFAA